jgi:hypothetical protein
MKTKNNNSIVAKSLLVVLVILFSQWTTAQKDSYKKEADIVFQSFKTKKYELLRPLLDPNVKIAEGIPQGLNDLVLPQIIKQLPAPLSYKIIKTEKKGATTKITAQYKYKDSTVAHYFVFNEKGKITDLNIFSDAKAEIKTQSK